MDIKAGTPYESENALAHIRKLMDIAVECESSLIKITEEMQVMHRGRKFKVSVELEDFRED